MLDQMARMRKVAKRPLQTSVTVCDINSISHSQHAESYCKACLGLLAIAVVALLMHDRAFLCNVPWRAWLRMGRVAHIRRRLRIGADSVQGDERHMGKHRDHGD